MRCVAWKWTPSLLALALFWTPDGLTAAGTNAMPTTTYRLIYKQSFDDGPATWQVGRKKAEPPNWHKNFLGEHGGGYPLAWKKPADAPAAMYPRRRPGGSTTIIRTSCGCR